METPNNYSQLEVGGFLKLVSPTLSVKELSKLAQDLLKNPEIQKLISFQKVISQLPSYTE